MVDYIYNLVRLCVMVFKYMIIKVLAGWYFNKKLFVHFLATNSTKYSFSKHKKIWALYKLGMYSSVLQEKSDNDDWRVLLAKVASYISLGNNEKCEELLKKWELCKICQQHNKLLAIVLAPYLPHKVLTLNVKTPLSKSLYTAVLIKLGQFDKAKEILAYYYENNKQDEEPELLLHYANTFTFLDTDKKLILLNSYLAIYKLPHLYLKYTDKSLSVHNIKANIKDSKIKKQDALVSIIMTTYNSEKTVHIAIDSILEQTYKNFELIIVDDASTDNTMEILKTYAKNNLCIRIISLSENVGTYVAKNRALKESKGIFVTFHDSDDFSLPQKIEKQLVPLLASRRVVATASDMIRIDINGKFYSRYLSPLQRLNHSSLMFRKEKVLKKIGFFDSVRIGADSEFFARISLVFGKKSIIRVKQPLSIGAHRENSLMTSKDTGYNKLGISPQRQAYWEMWNRWHIDVLASNDVLYLSKNQSIAEKLK